MYPLSELPALLDTAEAILEKTSWPPDAFAVLFDILAVDSVWQSVQTHFIDPERNPLLIGDEEVRIRQVVTNSKTRAAGDWTLSRAFKVRALSAIGQARAWLTNSGSTDPNVTSFPLEIACLSRAIDAEALNLSLYGASLLPDHLQFAIETLRRNGTFTLNAPGRVIPAAAKSRRGNSPQQFFANLLRIPKGADSWVDYGFSSSFPRRNVGIPLAVGFIPTVHERDEVTWSLEGGKYFSVGLNPISEAQVVSRVIKSMKWLLDRGAEVIVLPELVSSNSLRAAVASWLRDEASAQPILVVCGSEAVRSSAPTGWTNRAFVMGPSGRALWMQDKQHQYALSADEISELGLDSILGGDSRNEVGTCPRWLIAIRDIPGAGRFCVLVCEDFARKAPAQDAIEAFQVDMNLVIVMDGPFRKSGWRARHAMNFSEAPGARTAIGNSRAVLSRMKSRPRSSPLVAEVAYYCLIKQEYTSIQHWPKRSARSASAFLIAPISKV